MSRTRDYVQLGVNVFFGAMFVVVAFVVAAKLTTSDYSLMARAWMGGRIFLAACAGATVAARLTLKWTNGNRWKGLALGMTQNAVSLVLVVLFVSPLWLHVNPTGVMVAPFSVIAFGGHYAGQGLGELWLPKALPAVARSS